MANEQSPSNSHKKKVALGIVVVFVSIAVVYFIWTRDRVSTDDAFVDGHIFSISPRVAGYVTEVMVTDNQRVEKGAVLLTLDPTEYEVALAEAKATLAEAESTLTSLELGVPLELTQTGERVRGAEAELQGLRKRLEMKQKEEEAAAQELRRSKAEHDKAALDLRRMAELIKTRAISQSKFDEVETAAESAGARVGSAQARLEAVIQERGSLMEDVARLQANIKLAATGEDQAKIRQGQVEAQKARVALAKQRIVQAELNLNYTSITSPSEGHVTRRRAERGMMVSKGQPLLAVVPLNPAELWVTANYKETQLTKVRPGQKAKVSVDAYPGVMLTGKVESIMAGTGAVFSLFPPENASGNFVKVVQRIPVKIVLEPEQRISVPSLRIGMSVIPTVFTK
ncbi:MAG: HlyD family secretion protein [Thermodesulfobacteriota bacterium]